MNKIHHRLRLAQIDSTFQKSSLGKLSWLGGSAAAREQVTQNFLGDKRVSVAGNLERIFARVGFWGLEKSEEDVVKQLVFPAKIVSSAGRAGKGKAAENFLHNFGGIRTAAT